MNPITQLQQSTIRFADFVRLDLVKSDNSIETIGLTTADKNYKINGVDYLATGPLLSISNVQRDMRATSFDLTVQLSGAEQDSIFLVLGQTYKLKGSRITISRGFFSPTYQLEHVSNRYSGLISSYTITEDIAPDETIPTGTYSIGITCTSFKALLENRISGRFTNDTSHRKFFPTDSSFDRVASIADKAFDFGKPVASPASEAVSQLVDQAGQGE